MDLGYPNFTEIYINAWWPTLVEAKVHTWIYEKCSTIMGCIAITRRYNKWYGQQEYESIQLTGWWLTYPSEKYEFVSWDDDIPNIWKNKIPVPNHQPNNYESLSFIPYIICLPVGSPAAHRSNCEHLRSPSPLKAQREAHLWADSGLSPRSHRGSWTERIDLAVAFNQVTR